VPGRSPGGRARARELGLAPGRLPPGPANAITDVPGIRVGHATVAQGAGIRTGVTAIVHDSLLRAGMLPAGLAVFNGFGKMTGSTQIAELGTIETPVLLTATLSVFRVADALLSYLYERLASQGSASQGSASQGSASQGSASQGSGEPPGTLNPVVAETNDGYLSDIWARPVTAEHVRTALDTAAAGPVAEGCVGAGTGTGALGFKAGIGTSSRIADLAAGPVTLGVLVQANFSGELTVLGTPVAAAQTLAAAGVTGPAEDAGRVQDTGLAQDGKAARRAAPPGNSCVIVLATDAPLDSRQLERLASRAFAGMARAGSDFSGHSGDYALAVSTAAAGQAAAGREAAGAGGLVPANDLDVLFLAAIEATEEAILNSLFKAVTTTGFRGHIRYAVPLAEVQALAGSGTHPGTGNGRM
jgi:D-aminopeptidase